MNEHNLFSTETEVTEFLKSRLTRTEWKTDGGISSLLTFPYASPEVRALACAAITAYLEDRLRYWHDQSELNRYTLKIAAFLETARYTPAIEPLMRLRNKLETKFGDLGQGFYATEMLVAVRNAIATLHTTSSNHNNLIGAIEWYLERSQMNGLSPRCPFATVESCPRFYQSLSLLGGAGSTKISATHDKKLLKKWKKSPLWPVTDEQATSISGPNDGNKHFSKFCPEVSYERFGYFASGLYSYADEIDRENIHQKLSQLKVHQNDWRWYWANIEALHYSECSYYSLLHGSERVTEKAGEDIVEIKPNIWGIGLNLNAIFRKLKEWIRR